MEAPHDDPHEDVAVFCVNFTMAVVAWNNAEAAARSILCEMSEGGIGAELVILHLGNVALKDAMLAMADISYRTGHAPSDTARKHVTHFIEGMDVLRAYRNFYVHSLRALAIPEDGTGKALAVLHAKEARGKLAWIQQDLSTEELANFAGHAAALREYGNGIAAYLKFVNAPRETRGATWPSWPEKPTWPEKLTKTRDYLRAPPYQPESFQA